MRNGLLQETDYVRNRPDRSPVTGEVIDEPYFGSAHDPRKPEASTPTIFLSTEHEESTDDWYVQLWVASGDTVGINGHDTDVLAKVGRIEEPDGVDAFDLAHDLAEANGWIEASPCGICGVAWGH